MKNTTNADRARQIEAIATETLGLETTATRNSGDLDFTEIAAWNAKAALEQAHAAGRAETATPAAEALALLERVFAGNPNPPAEIAALRDALNA